MYRKQVRRRRAILVLLVVAALVLLSTQYSERQGGPLHSMQRAVASVFGPMEEGATRALKPARDLINWVEETFNARGTNSDLKAENSLDEPKKVAPVEQQFAVPSGEFSFKLAPNSMTVLRVGIAAK